MTARVLVIDSYDSFVYNLARYFGELGCETDVVRNDAFSVADVAALQPDAVVLSPGPCTPDEAGICVELVRQLDARVPVLGVCLGHQSIGQALGAEIVRADRLMHGKTDMIRHDDTGLLAGLENPFQATRYHSLIIQPGTLPDELVACAWSDSSDAEREIMGVRHREYPLIGWQFHPESFLTDAGPELLRRFVALRWPT